jgi:hypothetical protein
MASAKTSTAKTSTAEITTGQAEKCHWQTGQSKWPLVKNPSAKTLTIKTITSCCNY